MTVSLLRNLEVYQQAKRSTSSFTFSLQYCKDILKLLHWVLWACVNTPKLILSTCRKLVFICRQKINFISHVFLGILERYTNLFWVLWVSLVAHTQNNSINLQKTSMFIFMPKIHFIIYFFLEILHFKESCNLIG